jgi:hypothetical protein
VPPGPEETMKFLTLIVIAGIVAAGALVYANKDDLRRYLEMRQM